MRPILLTALAIILGTFIMINSIPFFVYLSATPCYLISLPIACLLWLLNFS